MNTFASTKKKLLVCLLAAAMGASAAAGGVLLKADAAEPVELSVNSEALFTASNGVTVKSASQYVTKSETTIPGDNGEQTVPANTPVGTAGLHFQ